MGLRRTTDAVVDPVTLAEVKEHLRVDLTDDDALITTLIRAAVQYVEDFTQRQLWTGVWEYTLDEFPANYIYLRHPPLVAVTSIVYKDTAGAAQTVGAATYTVFLNREPGMIALAYSQSWPATQTIDDAVTVTYTAGYADKFTANATTDYITLSTRVPVDTDKIRLHNSGGALPAGLAVDTDYYMRDSAAQTCKLALTSGGVAIDITGAGTGTHYAGEVPAPILASIKLIVADMYENRSAQGEENLKGNETVARLLWPYRTW